MNISKNRNWILIKSIIPGRLYEPMLDLFYAIRSIKFYGNKLSCPVCNNSFTKFINADSHGACPRCGAGSRHRILYLYLKKRTNFFTSKISLLHFAPEHCFYKKFKNMVNLNYIGADINSPRAVENIDMTNIKFPDNKFDVIISSHVLEHIENDIKAMKEAYRVLKRGGWSIHNVPIDYSRKLTYQNKKISTPEDRMKYYGHYDHKRIYGTDYKSRLESAGFLVQIINVPDFLTNGDIFKYNLNEKSKIYLCRKN